MLPPRLLALWYEHISDDIRKQEEHHKDQC